MVAKKENSPMSKTTALSKDERSFFADILVILHEGRSKAYIAVNYAITMTYWEVGKRIVEQEQHGKERANYGDFLIRNLSIYLGQNFDRGFSIANLKNIRRFYLAFQNDPKGYTLCSQLNWSHIRLIMRLDSEKVRHYYLAEAREQHWSVRVLERNINSGYYERLLSTQKKTVAKPRKPRANKTDEFIKDPYILEFLGLPEDAAGKESRFESAIINHLQEFLLEMGRGFSFVGRQFRISTETSHFYIDLVFYNYLLKCFIIIDLKTKKLTHQDIGQMDMYVRMFDDLKRGKDDNPTIGIILCADKDETIVKYSVLEENRRIFASRYKLVLPTEEELAVELERNTRYLRGVDSDG
jgi:predicted nuclease of restriction endonuclease-like (RecB) superfamily